MGDKKKVGSDPIALMATEIEKEDGEKVSTSKKNDVELKVDEKKVENISKDVDVHIDDDDKESEDK